MVQELKEEYQAKVSYNHNFNNLIIITYQMHNINTGKFIRIPELCTELVVPDLTGFKLKAYIGPGTKRNIREEVVKA